MTRFTRSFALTGALLMAAAAGGLIWHLHAWATSETFQLGQAQIAAIVGSFIIVYLFLLAVVHRASRLVYRHHEQALTHAAAAARADSASRTKSEFLANMSHELRTPLNAVIGFSEMIHEEMCGPIGNQRYREYAKDIFVSARHLLAVINDILDLARVEAGKFPVERSVVDLTELIESALTMVRPQADAAGVVLEQHIARAAQPVNTDARILRQIVLNLLANAVKFTPSGGRVAIGSHRNPGTNNFRIEIVDTGVGMQPQDIPRALAPFSQIDGDLSRRHEGTGLGLSLASRFAHLLGGDLTIASTVGRGTTVTVMLPANTTALAEAA